MTATIAIHGGCGTLAKEAMPESEWAEARAHLEQSLRAVWNILSGGGRAVDAVEAAVLVMEDSPHFNAGYGAAFNAAGEHELDASIMDGATLAAGAVCATRRIRNPVRAARAVMEHSDCVLLAGPAADAFAKAQGLDIVEPGYFSTERRREALARMRARKREGTASQASEADKHGTVGAVAIDRDGNLAAATSTGGFTNKAVGRVGDSPIIGAGTYARNGVCAVSCTGQGEYFIRHVAGHEIASLMAYAGKTLDEATHRIIFEHIAAHGIGGGLVAVDANGNVAAPFNTVGMYRGWIAGDGVAWVGTHQEIVRMGERAESAA